TGDGTLTALQLAAEMAATGRTMAELAAVMERLPQVLVNVPGVDRAAVGQNAALQAEVAAAEAKLGEGGRVLLRPSGTEPRVRVMVEAQPAEEAGEIADHLAGVVRTQLALGRCGGGRTGRRPSLWCHDRHPRGPRSHRPWHVRGVLRRLPARPGALDRPAVVARRAARDARRRRVRPPRRTPGARRRERGGRRDGRAARA